MFAIWSVLLALFLGAMALAVEHPEFVGPIVLVGHVALAAVFVRAVRSTGDILNPLSAIILLGTIRFTIPWLFVSSGVESRNPIYRLLDLGQLDWQGGELLALVGMLAIGLGWLLISDRSLSMGRISFALPAGVQYSALAGMVLGLAFLLLFLGGNAASITTVVIEGEFRGTTINEGTGVFFYLALLLPASSVVLCSFWIARGRRLAGLAAVGLSTLAFFMLGGRARAAVALIAGLLLLWYFRRRGSGKAERSSHRSKLAILVAGAGISLTILYAGAVYRGSATVPETGAASAAGLGAYVRFGILLDIGHLHALAASTAIGPGILHGQALVGPLTFPLTEVLGVPEISSGVFIVERTIGFPSATSRRWGFDASLMGDAYLNFGVPGVVVLCGIFGMALKALYRRFREGGLHAAVYVLAMIYAIRIVFESIEKWAELLTVVAFAVAVIHASWLFAVRRSPRQLSSASSRAPATIGPPSRLRT